MWSQLGKMNSERHISTSGKPEVYLIQGNRCIVKTTVRSKSPKCNISMGLIQSNVHWASHIVMGYRKLCLVHEEATVKQLCLPTTTAASSYGWMIAWSCLKQLPNEHASICPTKELPCTEKKTLRLWQSLKLTELLFNIYCYLTFSYLLLAKVSYSMLPCRDL